MTKPGSPLSLAILILAAGVANLNLAVANVALPIIGRDLGAGQVGLNLVAVGFTMGLAASVLYLGALGDRYGRRLMLILGLTASIPLAAMAAWAPSIEVLIIARLLGGVAAGMVYPTTLSILVATFQGKKRTTAIALWSGLGAGFSAIGPAIVGWLLTFAWWGAGFAITIPLAVLALILAFTLPKKCGETTESVDNTSGIASVVMIASLVLAITFAPMPGRLGISLILALIAVMGIVYFIRRQRSITNPLFDLDIAKRRIFWVAAIAGIIVFGALMGSFFIGQQFLQNVLQYNSFQAGLAILPSPVAMVAFAPIAARLIGTHGSRFTLLLGYAIVAAGFLVMMTWREGTNYAFIAIAYFLLGAGVSIAAAPASRSIMSAVPLHRLGMGSATNDLQRDLGGAVMQAVMGSLLVVRYASSMRDSFQNVPPDRQSELTDRAVTLMTSSYSGAEQVASSLPNTDSTILLQWASNAFSAGSGFAFAFALMSVVGGMALVWFAFPRKAAEEEVEAKYAAESEQGQPSN